jgi:hypothetical protein
MAMDMLILSLTGAIRNSTFEAHFGSGACAYGNPKPPLKLDNSFIESLFVERLFHIK